MSTVASLTHLLPRPTNRAAVELRLRLTQRRSAPAAAPVAQQARDAPPNADEAPLRFGEILAAATVPDFAGLPLEFWPGYRDFKF